MVGRALRCAGGPRRQVLLALLLGWVVWALPAALGPAHALGASLVVAPLAGTGSPGAAVPGPALASPLSSPAQIALDAAGDLYVADPGENRVLRIDATTATLSIVAGTGVAGAPVPGPAAASPLRAPSGVAVDGIGDVFIADTGNHVVEEVTPDGTLSVVAGSGVAGPPVAGPATASALGAPTGLALDHAGGLLIADAGGSSGKPSVERVGGGTLSVIAGNGTAGAPVAGAATSSPLRGPAGVASDATGDVFIADPGADVIEKVTPGGTLSIVAGRVGYSGAPRAGTATASRLSGPGAVALDAGGDLYIADTTNNRVEEVTPAGVLSTLGGTGATGRPSAGAAATSSALWGPAGVAVGADGVVDVALGGGASIDRLQPPPPAAAVAPAVSGTGVQGQTLTASPGQWSGTVVQESFAWQDCTSSGGGCTAISGASGPSYTLAVTDVGHTVRVVATASGPFGSGSSTSAATGVVLPHPPAAITEPRVTGTTTDRETLALSPGTWSGSPTLSEQWQTCNASGGSCTNIAGATSTTYALGQRDVGTTVRVVVTAVNPGGHTTVDTAASSVIAPVTVAWANVTPPSETARPIISGYAGGAVVGQTLTCSSGTWTGAPTTFTYAWSRDHQPIAGATSRTYTITAADQGYTLTCSVIATNAGGAIQADSYGVGVPGPRPGVPPLPTPPRTSVTASAPARTAGVTRAVKHHHRRRAGRGRATARRATRRTHRLVKRPRRTRTHRRRA